MNLIQKYKFIFISGLLVVALLVNFTFSFFSLQNSSIRVHPERLFSRAVMEYAEIAVKENRPSPPRAARLYAYVASTYYSVLKKTGSSTQAILASVYIINEIYPDTISSSQKTLGLLGIQKDALLTLEALEIFDSFNGRQKTDIDLSYTPKKPVGSEYWTGLKPVEPGAGGWKRWNVKSVYSAPPPPILESEEFLKSINLVKEATASRTREQYKAISFWAGIPGSETPSGIWQNELFRVTADLNLTDENYAYAQMILSQTIADAFIEAWKIKYTYWTKRPSMVDTTISTSMPNPSFPSYVSGHATISRAGSEVLSVMFPQYRTVWGDMALQAKNSRLWAGIHFPYDNEVGANLGRQIGEDTAKVLELAPVY